MNTFSAGSGSDEEIEFFTEIFSWGNDSKGQLGLGPANSKGYKTRYSLPRYCTFNVRVTQISCGLEHTVFVTDMGLIYSMGSNSCGQLGIGEVPSASANKYSPILLESLLEIDPY